MKAQKALRKGFTTGTCAAAGAKAAAHALFGSTLGKRAKAARSVFVSLPRGGELKVPINRVLVEEGSARASVIKDAGDDPDVTNKAEFITEVRITGSAGRIVIKGGEGVGTVTKPGLKIRAGRPAINPVPLKMIRRAVKEEMERVGVSPSVRVTVTVPKGSRLAEKTMNPRLGIVGGISILGTTGIVEPMSLAAFTHSIYCGVDVAVAGGLKEVVFSTGRSSEKAAEKLLKLPEVSYILTGDHMGSALCYASGKKGIEKVVVAGQFGKFTKLSAGNFETHCSDSSVDFGFLSKVARRNGAGEDIIKKILKANTAREVYFILREEGLDRVIKEVVRLVKENSAGFFKGRTTVRAMLAGYDNAIFSSGIDG
ncbi:MAG: cobalt-precorrin-5B (C(1))-methyltransferase [Deltaproteobacteria bacterium]|nr:cobalt-precorrin-5B (C(1))-methyltransferase [Deltaproteobacteria bacterium]